MKIKAYILSVLLVLFTMAMVVNPAFATDTWNFYFPLTITDNTGASRSNIPVLAGGNFTGNAFYNNGLMSANGTDTRMKTSGIDTQFMMDTTQVPLFVSSLPANSSVTYNLYTGYSPLQSNFPIIVGNSGNFSTAYNAALALGSNFNVSMNGFVNTSAGANKFLMNDQNISIQVSPSVSGNVTANITSTKDSYTTVSNSQAIAGAGSWCAQSFTAGSSYSIWGVMLPLARAGNPGSVVASIRANSSGPTGGDLAVGTYDGNLVTLSGYGYYVFQFATPYAITSTTVYDIVVRDVSGDGSNYVAWYSDPANGYAGGQKYTSADSGVTWTGAGANADHDQGFYTLIAPASVSATSVASGNHTIEVGNNGLAFAQASSQYASVPYSTDFDFTSGGGVDTAFTIIALINPTDTSSAMIAAHKPTGGWEFYSNVGADLPYIYLFDATGGNINRRYNSAFTTSTYSVATITYDGSKTNGGIICYLNGSPVASTGGSAGSYTGMPAGSAVMNIGAGTSGTVNFNGSFGELRIYKGVALTAAQVLADYQGTVVTTNLVAWYKMNEGTGNPQDSSGKGNNATSNTGTWAGNLFNIRVDGGVKGFTTGIAVPANTNGIVWDTNNVMPFINSANITIGGVQKLQYQPNVMLTGTTLTDRKGTQDGVISWGSNSGMTITYGAMVSNAATSAAGGTTGAGITIPAMPMPAQWFASGSALAQFLAPAIQQATNSTGGNPQVMYFLAILGIAFILGMYVAHYTRGVLFGFGVAIAVLWFGMSGTIVPGWFIFGGATLGIGILYLARQYG